jgi:phosphatidylinositol alpha-mannosyltransferase
VVTDGEQGLLVPPQDTDALAVALNRLLGDPDARRAMRARGQLKARLYDWPRIASQVLDFYDDVLDRRVDEPTEQRVRFQRVRRVANFVMRV